MPSTTSRFTLLLRSLEALILLTFISSVIDILTPSASLKGGLQGASGAFIVVVQLITSVIWLAAYLALRQWFLAVQQGEVAGIIATARAVDISWAWQPWSILVAALSGWWIASLSDATPPPTLALAVILVPACLAFALWWFFVRAVRHWVESVNQRFIGAAQDVPHTVQEKLLVWLTWAKWINIIGLVFVVGDLVADSGLFGAGAQGKGIGVGLLDVTSSAVSLVFILCAHRFVEEPPVNTGEQPQVAY
ncbi:hypothetical protein [Deinococcus hohokamensis]|uniref:DUF4328 domain-containing protein n=1 Tax=Deinococcus hohokamensis TaxID=309883 RepID=A0ABV9IDY3_9DEIO